MRIISEDDCRTWLSEKLHGSFDWNEAERVYGNSVTYLIPSDTGKKTALARALSTMVGGSGHSLLWITEWSVFPSSENMALFMGYRHSFGDERSVYAAPGHLFEAQDVQQVECLLDLILYFFWDASVFDAGSVWLRLSHDEVFSIRAKDLAALKSCEEALSRYQLKELSRSAS